MKIEIEKEDFVRLAAYALYADLSEKESKYEMTLKKIMDSLDEEDTTEIVKDIVRIKMLNGTNVEEMVKTIVEKMAGDDE